MPTILNIGNTDTERQPHPEHVPGQETPLRPERNEAMPAPAALKDTVGKDDVLKLTDYTKIPSLSLGGGATGGGTALPGTGNTVAVGGMLDGKLAVNLMDSVLPAVFILVFNKVGMKMRKSDLQLTAQEKDTLAPVMKAWLDTMMINFNNPATAFFCTVGIIYGSKILEKGGVQWLDDKNAAKEAKALQERAKKAQEQTPEARQEKINKETAYAIEISAAQSYIPDAAEIKAFAKKAKCSAADAPSRIVFNKIKEVKDKYGYA